MFSPAWWLPGAHLQTVFPAVFRHPRVHVTRETWETPDGDVLDVDFLPRRENAPGVVVLHGLEGSSRAGYARGILARAERRGWNGAGLNFRSCGPTPPRGVRSYHSGETTDLEFVVSRLPWRPLYAVGFSLGGNVLLKWLGEKGASAPIARAAAVSPPFDLAAAADALDSAGPWSAVYRGRFLRSLRRKALRTCARHPGSLDPAAVRGARTFASFDHVVTAKIHGFRDARDYWERSSCAQFLPGIRVPTLLVASHDDPIVPGRTLPRTAIEANPALTLRWSDRGGHVGFVTGPPWKPRFYAEEEIFSFLAT